MSTALRPLQPHDIDAVQAFTEAAFEPIFESWRSILGEAIFNQAFSDWRNVQRGHVTTFDDDPHAHCWIATVDDQPAGFIAYTLNHDSKQGVVEFLVVHPAHQGHGIAGQLNQFAIDQMRNAGMTWVEVGTGGDPAHAAARRVYERAGYIGLPAVYYYKSLGD